MTRSHEDRLARKAWVAAHAKLLGLVSNSAYVGRMYDDSHKRAELTAIAALGYDYQLHLRLEEMFIDMLHADGQTAAKPRPSQLRLTFNEVRK